MGKLNFPLIDAMLIGEEGTPFDDPKYQYELKFDGVRCLAYLGKDTNLRNKRQAVSTNKYPELLNLHKYVKKNCVLDGELVVFKNGKPYFDGVKRRALMYNALKIKLIQQQLPVTFVAFDLLYYDDEDIMQKPLSKRRKLLFENCTECPELFLSRSINEQGNLLFRSALEQGLEGIIAKKKNSVYLPGSRTKNWIKIKNWPDDDFVVCGFVDNADSYVVSVCLGQYQDNELKYYGHVALGKKTDDFYIMNRHKRINKPEFPITKGNDKAEWLKPDLVCRVAFLDRTPNALRQAVFKGLRDDKLAPECIYPS